jgi:streptomycin 6-kinase
MIVVPDEVARLQAAANGDAGIIWVASVPALVAEFVDRWQLREVGPAYEDGAVSFVAPVLTAEGADAVLKVGFVDDETRYEADALRAWAGRGAVRVIATEPDLGALLLERLVPGTSLETHPDRDEAISIACGLLRRLWQAPRADHRFRSAGDLAASWAIELPLRWSELGGPFDEALVTHAAALCRELETPDRAQIIANRDFHLGNVLSAQRAPWLVIDPKPLAGEPAFDSGHLIGTLLADSPTDDEADALIARIAHALDQSHDRVRAWAFVRAIENALWASETGLGDSDAHLAQANALA